MRLCTDQVATIRQEVLNVAGDSARGWLFGSRVRDAARGDDVDLLVEMNEAVAEPALLSALAETAGPAIDNLDKAEKIGWIESTEGWMEMRRLRNQMVHEYIEDLTVLCSALRSSHAFVPSLVAAATGVLLKSTCGCGCACGQMTAVFVSNRPVAPVEPS